MAGVFRTRRQNEARAVQSESGFAQSGVKSSLPKRLAAASEGPGGVISVWKHSDLRVAVGST